MQTIFYGVSTIYNCSLLLCGIAIVYWLLKQGKVKQEVRVVLLAGNWLLLGISTVYIVYWTIEFLAGWCSGVEYEQYAFKNRATGPYWFAYWSMLVFAFSPQLFWFSKIRNSVVAAFVISLLVNWGRLFERLVIIITSFHRDYLPSSWMMYHPFNFTLYEIAVYLSLLALVYVALKWKEKNRQGQGY